MDNTLDASVNKSVNWSRYIRGLWENYNDDPLNATEVAMVLYLIYRANRNRWVMPFKCSTTQMCNKLQISRPTFTKAREGLSRRGMITFAEGMGPDAPSTYSVVLPAYAMRRPQGAEPALCSAQSPAAAPTQTNAPTPTTAPELTSAPTPAPSATEIPAQAPAPTRAAAPAPISNLMSAYVPAAGGVGELVDLSVLHTRLLSDVQWMAEIVELMMPIRTMCTAEVKAEMADFFRYLRCQGITAKSEPECRRHFVNWLRKQSTSTNLNQSNYGTNKANTTNTATSASVDKRRPSPVTATSASDYEGMF